MLDNDEEETRGWAHAIRDRAGVIIGTVGMVAWLAMVWLMFGDVL